MSACMGNMCQENLHMPFTILQLSFSSSTHSREQDPCHSCCASSNAKPHSCPKSLRSSAPLLVRLCTSQSMDRFPLIKDSKLNMKLYYFFHLAAPKSSPRGSDSPFLLISWELLECLIPCTFKYSQHISMWVFL